MTPKEPAEFDEVTPGTEDDATDLMPENALPVEPGALEPEVVGVRQGMFGVQGSGDTSGYGGIVRPVVMPSGTPKPYGGWFDEVAEAFESALTTAGITSAIEKVVVHRGEITFFIRRGDLLQVAKTLRDDPALRFEFCSGVSGVHYPGDDARCHRAPLRRLVRRGRRGARDRARAVHVHQRGGEGRRAPR